MAQFGVISSKKKSDSNKSLCEFAEISLKCAEHEASVSDDDNL